MAMQKIAGELAEAVSKNVDEVAEAASASGKKIRFGMEADGQMYIPGTKKRGRPSKASAASTIDEMADAGNATSGEIDGQMSLFGYGENTLEGQRVRQNIEKNQQQRSNIAKQRQDAEGRALDKAADDKMTHQAKMDQMKENARNRIKANREARDRIAQTRQEREVARAANEKQHKANELKEKIKQRQADKAAGKEVSYEGDLEGMGGERSRSYSQSETQGLISEARSGYSERSTQAQHALKEANKTGFQRFGDKIKEAGRQVYDTTLNRRRITAERRAYNAQVSSSSPESMFSTNREYLHARNQANRTRIEGGYNGPAGADDIAKASRTGPSPEDIAGENSTNGLDWDGISQTIKENQLLVAGGLIGGGMVMSSLLDDD